jgi:hypothetical protein
VAGCFECGDEPSGSCATELVIYHLTLPNSFKSASICFNNL